ncbi:MAG: hypothetical protein GY705_01140, partial [Bacteroidetes bacterium]|nr:hypothetical protein [Bacteroidota bacterium]
NAGVDRVGKDWAEKIYSQYDEYVDGIAFDYWDRKDLIELWRFNSAVSMAAEIIRSNDSDNNQKEEIVINQTSMSPGTSSSPYDVNTHFSALWLVGAICNAFSSGELDAFHYFTTVDDERHMKGLMYSDQVPSALPYQQKASPYELKPMGHAMAMINQTIQEEVVILNSDSLEVDALLTIDTQGNTLSLIVGNKFNRINKLDIQVPLPEIMWNKKLSVSAKKLNATMKQPDYHTIKTNIFTKTNFIFSHELEPETIYSFHFTRLSSSLEPPAYFKLGVEPL